MLDFHSNYHSSGAARSRNQGISRIHQRIPRMTGLRPPTLCSGAAEERDGEVERGRGRARETQRDTESDGVKEPDEDEEKGRDRRPYCTHPENHTETRPRGDNVYVYNLVIALTRECKQACTPET